MRGLRPEAGSAVTGAGVPIPDAAIERLAELRARRTVWDWDTLREGREAFRILARDDLAAVAPLIVAAELERIAGELDALAGVEPWRDCLGRSPHTRAAGNCVTPPDWLRARADQLRGSADV